MLCTHVSAICRARQPAGWLAGRAHFHITNDKRAIQWQRWLMMCSTTQVVFTDKRLFGMNTRGQNNPGSCLSREANNIKINMSSL